MDKCYHFCIPLFLTLSTITQACFGSPKFDRKEPLHILSADSRFPDLKPGEQLSSGNHFMAIFPEYLIEAVHNNREKKMKQFKRKKKKGASSGTVRGGGIVNTDSVIGDEDDVDDGDDSVFQHYTRGNINGKSKKSKRGRKKKRSNCRSTSSNMHKSMRRGGGRKTLWCNRVLGVCHSVMKWLLCL